MISCDWLMVNEIRNMKYMVPEPVEGKPQIKSIEKWKIITNYEWRYLTTDSTDCHI